MEEEEENSVSAENFEMLLDEDSTFVEFFNSFLALPMFPIRLHYNPDVGCFEEFKHKLADDVMDDNAKRAASLSRFSHFKSTIDVRGFKIGYYVKFLDKEEGIEWIKKNRLSLFLRSEICAEYKLARSLSNAQVCNALNTQYLVNILLDSTNLQRAAFDVSSAPKYRTNRNRGTLPGLAEFQKQILAETKVGCGDNDSTFDESSSSSVSNASDTEAVEFSEFHHKKPSSSEDESILIKSVHSPIIVEPIVADIKDKEEAANLKELAEVDEKPSRSIGSEKTERRESIFARENDAEIIAETPCKANGDPEDMDDSSEKNKDMLLIVEEHADVSQSGEYADDYNILTVMDSLKSRFEKARRFSKTEHANEDATENEESRVVTAESGSGQVNTVSNSPAKEECEETEAAHFQKDGTNIRDANNNESEGDQARSDLAANDEEEKTSKSVHKILQEFDKKQCWVKGEADNQVKHLSKLLRNASFDLKTHRSTKDQSSPTENTNKKVLRKRHSLPHNNTLLLKEFQLPNDNEPLPLIRRQSMPVTAFVSSTERQSRGSIDSIALQEITKILLAKKAFGLKHQETLQSMCAETDADDESSCSDMCLEPRRPIDIASKIGMDAFKMFIIGTPGEKLFLLWIEIEKLKAREGNEEKLSLVQEIRKRFFRSGAAYELKLEALRRWNISNVADINYHTLMEIQDKVQAPLKHYWCARFTFHQKRKHKSKGTDYVINDHQCMKSRCSTHQRELTRVPQRPNTCFPNIRTKSNLDGNPAELSARESKASLMQDSDKKNAENVGNRTIAKIRSKSAHPRLINTSNIKDVNLSYKQLQVITTIDEGCGFKALPYCRYRNDATSSDEKANVRLYIQPLPPNDCTASTIERSITGLPKSDKVEENELMDSLVECLLQEKNSGSFFHQHLQQKKNQLALFCYQFWKALQDYNEHFFSESFSPSLIKQKAGYMFTAYIINGSQNNINCPQAVQDEIHKALDPPYEDLFDKAEEHALKILSTEYRQLFSEENNKYEEIKKQEKIKYLDVRSTLKKPKYRPKENMSSEDTEEEDSREKISIEEMNSPMPVASDGITFESFIRNKHDLETFKDFLERKNNKGLRDLLAWTEMENFRRSTRRNDQRNTLAKSVRFNWLTSDYFFGSNSPATKEAQTEVKQMAEGSEIPDRPPSPLIFEAQKYVRARIERRWFLMFKETQGYQSKVKESNITEMVEDMIMKRRLQRSEAAWKILNSRWVSGSRDVVALRQILIDPIKCENFRKFLSLKGDLMDHNVYFWLEVQKYKDLCHRHVENAIIKTKIQAIIDVFIKSAVPPELQIDVPIEIAERLHEKATGRVPQHGPYLFREAQTTVFRIMFNHWKEFLSFRSSIEEPKIKQHLEELHKKHKAELRAKRMITERRRLAKVAYEKRKKEKEEKERSKEKPRIDITSTLGQDKTFSLISDDEETALQTRSFSYSKFTIEQQLTKLEQRMREEGYAVEEYTEGDFTQSYVNGDRKSFRKISAMDDQKSSSGTSFRTHRKKSENIWKSYRNDSLLREPIAEFSEDEDEHRGGSHVEKLHRPTAKLINVFDGRSKGGSSVSKKVDVSRKHRRKNGSKAKKEHLSNSTENGKTSIMPGPQRPGTVLTIQSLQEFDKSTQGKAIGTPLPFVRVTSTEEKSEKDSKRIKSVISRPASKSHPKRTIQRMLASGKREKQNEKRPPEKIVVT